MRFHRGRPLSLPRLTTALRRRLTAVSGPVILPRSPAGLGPCPGLFRLLRPGRRVGLTLPRPLVPCLRRLARDPGCAALPSLVLLPAAAGLLAFDRKLKRSPKRANHPTACR